jgi:hypothetical protein
MIGSHRTACTSAAAPLKLTAEAHGSLFWPEHGSTTARSQRGPALKKYILKKN